MANMRLFFILISILIISACSPQKQLQKLLEKYPELKETETVIVQDTIYISENRTDTAFVFNSLIDTVLITNDRVDIRIIREYDTIKVNSYVKPDTVIISKPIEVEKIKYVKEKQKLNYNYLLIFGIVFMCLTLFALIKRRSNPD